MPNKIITLKNSYGGLLAFALLAAQPARAEAPITGKLYYDHALSAYEQQFAYSNPQHMSHPPHYTAEVRELPGPYGQEMAIRTHSTSFYGLYPVNITLFLRSGAMHVRAEEGGPPTLHEYTLNPPDTRYSDYFQYRAKLAKMIEDLDFLQKDEKPELAQVITYLQAVDLDVSRLADVLGAELPYRVRPGQTYEIKVTARTAGPRDVLVDFLDAKGWYVGSRASLSQQGDSVSTSLSITIPRAIAAPETAYLSVKLVPPGASWESRLFEEDQATEVLPIEEIVSFYATYVYTKRFEVSYRVVSPDPRDLIIEIVDPHGQLALTQRFELLPGEQSVHYRDLPAMENVELNQTYQVKAYLVPQGGDKTQAIDEASYDPFTYSYGG